MKLLRLEEIINAHCDNAIYGFGKDFYADQEFLSDELMVLDANLKCIAQYNYYADIIDLDGTSLETPLYIEVNEDDRINQRSPQNAFGDYLDDIIEVREGLIVAIINDID